MSEKLGTFLFIGLGGSGGKTLQYLHNNLRLRLSAVNKPMPKGWQFLWLDVPQNPDALESGAGIKPLPEKYYFPLTNIGLSYSKYDITLRKRFPEVQDILAGWSPEGYQVKTPITTGAGQFRAIGRVITMKSYKEVYQKVKDSLDKLNGAAVQDELDEIQNALSPHEVDSSVLPPEPMVVLVSSLAGGSGAGSTIDVADIVRSVIQNNNISSDSSVGFLYSPDIFLGEKKLQGNSSIHANAIFTLSEILSGYYDSEETPPNNLMWSTFSMLSPESRRRGPRYNFLIGRSNGKVTFQTPQDVFRNTGKLLSQWCLDPQIDSDIREFILTNWEAESTKNPTNTGLIKQYTDAGDSPFQPFNSLGYSSVNLGREFFREYASKRVARKAIFHLLEAHWDSPAEKKTMSSAKKIAIKMDNIRQNNHLLVDSGLNERGADNNEIKNKIEDEAKTGLLNQDYTNRIFSFAANDDEERNKKEWAERFSDSFNQHKNKFVEEVRQHHIKNAKKWVEDFNVDFTNFISKTISEEGAPLTLAWLEDLDIVLQDTIDDETIGLKKELLAHQGWEKYTQEYIEEKLNPLGDETFTKSHQVMSSAKAQISKSLQYNVNIDVINLTMELVEGVKDDVIPKFRKLLTDLIQKSKNNIDTTRDNGPGKELNEWPEDTPTYKLAHSENEVLIEETDEYPKIYQDLLNDTYRGEAQDEKAEEKLIQKIISGKKIPYDFMELENKDKEALWDSSLIKIKTPWAPSQEYLRDNDVNPQNPEYSFDVDIFKILDKAQHFISEKETPFGEYLSESLNDYLDEKKARDDNEYQNKKDKFMLAFNKALDYANPQIEINTNLHKLVHNEEQQNIIKPSKIPIKDNDVKDRIVQSLLPKFDNDTDQVNKFFTSENTTVQSIDFFSHYAVPMDATVMRSLWTPFIEHWNGSKGDQQALSKYFLHRRSRPLSEFVPLHPKIIISFIKGFFISKLRNQYSNNRNTKSANQNLKVEVEIKDYGKVSFPYPLIDPNPMEQDELGSLLLTLPLAMALYSTEEDPNALLPYEHLIDLGLDTRGVAGSQNISAGLDDYLNTLNDQKIEEDKNMLQYWFNNYQELIQNPIYDSNRYNRYPGLGWEATPMILEGLGQIIKNIEDYQSSNSTGGGNRFG